MVTMKLEKDVIVCDDIKSVGIINSNTMEKIHSIQLHEFTYLHSIFMH
jgi:hypothetical protein